MSRVPEPAWIRADAPLPAPAPSADGQGEVLLVSPDAETAVPLTAADRAAAVEVGAEVLGRAGVAPGDRVAVALNGDGEQTGALVAEAAAAAGASAASLGPRGRMRLHRALESLAATVLVATPTGALDLLARLHAEFLVDPLDLGLRRILLAGEITGEHVRRQLAAEFDAEVAELFVDPLLQTPVACRDAGGGLHQPRPGLVELAPPAKDEALRAPYPSGTAELVTRPLWHSALASTAVRTGFAAAVDEGADLVPLPGHTVGGRVLVRGRWLSLPRLERALAPIDGIGSWELRVSRPGTLDTAALHVSFTRESLVGDPMWTKRIEQALLAVSPVHVGVATGLAAPDLPPGPATGSLTDERGHHLGRDRDAL
ncbi:hypothetical protein [Nocardiopsis composta]|uniref:Phenylacetate-CoA ligase n=2 Tax=Nocardiopsis composta TaxID=157465 RepID=A0A7W8QT75_9ACTN|nr:hypothetical protein [Nocardiopsis composta]MBB5435126.1 phenylacetate-CoA ligase [Nocardiopsis composta]